MEKLDRITLNPNVCLGQPTIRGMRITVSVILKMLASSKFVAQVLKTLLGIKILRLRFFEKNSRLPSNTPMVESRTSVL
ncbi:hypothetical protein NSTC745_04491 [Nostoc sp. DSM 114161]|jgi:uncharacterized protein (DUF433 family)|uniref:DUF433 domain-containing protein n=1 Tax=Nostoc sp. DSM 114161 TaxID=3440143 RepID=UPI004045F352